MKIHAGHIEVAVAKLFGYRQNLIVPNISWGWDLRHEADMIIVNDSNRVTEVEIKISLSDLKADFKKKNGHISKKIGRLYYAIPLEMLDKSLELIPKECGIITVKKYDYTDGTAFHASYYRIVKFNKFVEPISNAQRLKLSELGCMRIWTLKDTLHKKYHVKTSC